MILTDHTSRCILHWAEPGPCETKWVQQVVNFVSPSVNIIRCMPAYVVPIRHRSNMSSGLWSLDDSAGQVWLRLQGWLPAPSRLRGCEWSLPRPDSETRPGLKWNYNGITFPNCATSRDWCDSHRQRLNVVLEAGGNSFKTWTMARLIRSECCDCDDCYDMAQLQKW